MSLTESVFHTIYQDLSAEVAQKLSKIKLVVFDVDGTITDGGIYLDRQENELKKFNGKDGMGIALLHYAGIHTALITGRDSPLTQRRAKEIKIDHVIQGIADKKVALEELLEKLNLSKDEVAVMGDDVNDIPLFENAAVSACPNDGYHYMKKIATIVLTLDGGRGAAREFCDLIMMVQGKITADGRPLVAKEGISFKPGAQ